MSHSSPSIAPRSEMRGDWPKKENWRIRYICLLVLRWNVLVRINTRGKLLLKVWRTKETTENINLLGGKNHRRDYLCDENSQKRDNMSGHLWHITHLPEQQTTWKKNPKPFQYSYWVTQTQSHPRNDGKCERAKRNYPFWSIDRSE